MPGYENASHIGVTYRNNAIPNLRLTCYSAATGSTLTVRLGVPDPRNSPEPAARLIANALADVREIQGIPATVITSVDGLCKGAADGLVRALQENEIPCEVGSAPPGRQTPAYTGSAAAAAYK